MNFLLGQELPVNENDYVMQTPFYYCAKYNQRLKVAEMLIAQGCDVNHKDANGQTCLFYAAAEGNLEMCQLLAENGANLLATDKNKERPMHYARRGGHRSIIDFLNGFNRKEMRKVQEMREERPIQESSQNTVDRKRKKEGSVSECTLVFTNQEGQTHRLSFGELLAFKEASEQNKKLFRVMVSP